MRGRAGSRAQCIGVGIALGQGPPIVRKLYLTCQRLHRRFLSLPTRSSRCTSLHTHAVPQSWTKSHPIDAIATSIATSICLSSSAAIPSAHTHQESPIAATVTLERSSRRLKTPEQQRSLALPHTRLTAEPREDTAYSRASSRNEQATRWYVLSHGNRLMMVELACQCCRAVLRRAATTASPPCPVKPTFVPSVPIARQLRASAGTPSPGSPQPLCTREEDASHCLHLCCLCNGCQR